MIFMLIEEFYSKTLRKVEIMMTLKHKKQRIVRMQLGKSNIVSWLG